MLRDAQWVLSDAQAVTTAAATASTNVYDTLGPAPSNLGIGEELWVVCSINTTVTSDGSATVAFALQTDDNESFSSATTIHSVSAIAKATLVAGYRVFAIRLPTNCERYIRALITVATADLTAGKFDIYLTRNVDLLPSTPHPRATYSVA
jgi:hypothetical protein